MKKLVLLLLFVPVISFGQTYYGYKSRTEEKATIKCEELLEVIEDDGREVSESSSWLSSSAIDSIVWHTWKGMLFAVVKFKNSRKQYIYGGWEDDGIFGDSRDLIEAYDDAESKGTFFNKYIRSATIDCS